VGILGAGRQAFETSGYCKESGVEVAFFVEERPPDYDRDSIAYGAPILTIHDALGRFAEVPVVSAVGSPDLRHALVEQWTGSLFFTVISARGWLATDVGLGVGSTVAPLAALNRCVVLGEHALVNVGAILSHDVVVGPYSTVSPGCTIGGGARVGTGVFIGIGATIIDHVAVGDGAYVAAGAVVVTDVGAGDTVMGVPAKPTSRRR
jgi:sugar O-acyltransferase (sialic acid O-acetyltransferase NeuD family)